MTREEFDQYAIENGLVVWSEEMSERAIKALEQKPKTEWIPVSERLPEKTGRYLVSIGDLVSAENFDGHHFRTRSYVRFGPDAWMPLPEPYKEG